MLLRFGSWGPKRLAESESVSVSLKKKSTNMFPESPHTKKASPEPKYPRFSVLLFHVSCVAVLIYCTEEILQ